MFAYANSAASAYAKVGVETGVETADPHQLVVMLFDGALLAIATARFNMEQNSIAAKGKAISHAISIIGNGLRASLDMSAGGELAQNLAALYDYMTSRLLDANVHNSPAVLDEVAGLLAGLKDAWVQIGEKPSALNTASSARIAAAA